MIHLQNNIPFEPRRALQWCHNQNVAQWYGWQLKTNKQTKSIQKTISSQNYPLLSYNKTYFQPHYLRTDIRSWPQCRRSYFVIQLTQFNALNVKLVFLRWTAAYLPIWTLLGKAPIVSPQTQENSSKSWLQEILILLVQICERHWGWRQLGKGQKRETLLEIHCCRVFPLQWHEPWCDSVRR